METTATLVRLPKKTLIALKLKAAQEGTSLAALIRRALINTYGFDAEEPAADIRKTSFYKLVGCVDSGDAASSLKHDEHIYGVADAHSRRYKRARRAL